MINVLLSHGERRRFINPSLQQIKWTMLAAQKEDGPPELELLFGDHGIGQPQLGIMCLFADSNIPTEWCVRFYLSKAKTSKYLAASLSTETKFLERTLCGCIVEARCECILNDELVLEAAEWFIQHGTAKPSLTWLDSDESIIHL